MTNLYNEKVENMTKHNYLDFFCNGGSMKNTTATQHSGFDWMIKAFQNKLQGAVNHTAQYGFMPASAQMLNYKNYTEPKPHVGKTYTEEDFTEEELNELKRQVTYARSLGYDFWSDHGSVKKDGTIIPSMQEGLYGVQKPETTMDMVTRLFMPQPQPMLETLLGHYNFYIDKDGNTIITDQYDFDPAKGGFNAFFAPFLGSVKDGNKNMKFNINLGKLPE